MMEKRKRRRRGGREGFYTLNFQAYLGSLPYVLQDKYSMI
jgi:hypothetical protein